MKDVDIRCSPSVDDESVSQLEDAIFQAELDLEHGVLYQRSLEIVVASGGTVSLVFASAFLLAKLIGVQDYFKARMQERGKIDAQRADQRRRRREAVKQIRDSQFVDALSRGRKRGVQVKIDIHIPPEKFSNGMECSHQGGFPIRGSTKDEFAFRLEAFVFHTPALLDLIDNEILPKPILGGVYLELLEDGALKVTWMFQKDMKKQTRIIRPDDPI